jgi:hypothetical protein
MGMGDESPVNGPPRVDIEAAGLTVQTTIGDNEEVAGRHSIEREGVTFCSLHLRSAPHAD